VDLYHPRRDVELLQRLLQGLRVVADFLLPRTVEGGRRQVQKVQRKQLVGAALLIPLSEFTRIQFGGTGRAADLVIYGALLTGVAVFQPAGIVGLVGRRRGGG